MGKIIKELEEYGAEVIGFDPVLKGAGFEDVFGIKLLKDWRETAKSKADCIIFTVAHSPFRKLKLSNVKKMENVNPVLIDVRGIFDGEEAKREGFYYKTL